MVTNPLFWILLIVGPVTYWSLPVAFRMWVLATISAIYVASISGWGMAALAVLMLLTWAVPSRAGGQPSSRRWLWLALVALLGYLSWFKYVPELARQMAPQSSLVSVALPVGISFFVFKLIHVAIESFRGNLAGRSSASFAAYVFLFPTFSAGPIEQYDHFLRNAEPRPSREAILEGTRRIMVGLVKRFVIAEVIIFDLMTNNLSAGGFLSGLGSLSAPYAWYYLACAFLYAYFDFAGYSDIAIGASRLFGIRVMENFDNPMMSRNIQEFWKRWHMTLAAWTQRYVYMPVLGVTRNPWAGVYLTFIVMGLWHAGTLAFLCWGLYHATGVSIALIVQRVRRSRQGRPLPLIDRIPYWGTVLTWVFLVGSAGITVTSGHESHAMLRVFAKLVGIYVPA